jgi:hypothetical protein
VVLLIPAILSSPASLLAAAAEADEEAVTWITVELREAVTTVVVRVAEDGEGVADDSSAEGEGEASAASGTSELTGVESSELDATSTEDWAGACDWRC